MAVETAVPPKLGKAVGRALEVVFATNAEVKPLMDSGETLKPSPSETVVVTVTVTVTSSGEIGADVLVLMSVPLVSVMHVVNVMRGLEFSGGGDRRYRSLRTGTLRRRGRGF